MSSTNYYDDDEQTEFDIIITHVGDKKINAIQVVRVSTGLGLKESKELVESPLPITVKKWVSIYEAEEIKAKLEAIGATAKVVPSTNQYLPNPNKEEGEQEQEAKFNVVITHVGDNNMGIIKAIQDTCRLGLKEAKSLVESRPLPITVKEGVSLDEAEETKRYLEAVGATVEIR